MRNNDLVNGIIEIFEDFLADKNVKIVYVEKIEARKEGQDETEIANIYGTDYGILQTEIEDLFEKYNVSSNILRIAK